METMNYVKPRSKKQDGIRKAIDEVLSGIKEPHCKICGDTDDLKTVGVLKGKEHIKMIFCEFCYNIQINMR